MVGGVPAAYALRDLFYAAGLGFVLCVCYSAARLLLGSGRAACFACDAGAFALGALLYRSAAMSRFFAGQPRWYTLTGCLLCFFACRAALAPLLGRVEAFVRWCAAWPFVMLWRVLLRPLCGAAAAHARAARQAHRLRRQKRKRLLQKKRLQNSAQVLYNSK